MTTEEDSVPQDLSATMLIWCGTRSSNVEMGTVWAGRWNRNQQWPLVGELVTNLHDFRRIEGFWKTVIGKEDPSSMAAIVLQATSTVVMKTKGHMTMVDAEIARGVTVRRGSTWIQPEANVINGQLVQVVTFRQAAVTVTMVVQDVIVVIGRRMGTRGDILGRSDVVRNLILHSTLILTPMVIRAAQPIAGDG
jgi:hypothetical protein